MKEEAILKMNKVGKVGSIIANIIRVILIVGLIGCIIGAVAVIILPKNLVNVRVYGEAQIDIDVSEFDITFTEADKANIKDEIASGNTDIDINGIDYNATAVEVGDSGFTMMANAESRMVNLDDLLYVLIVAIATLVFSIITATYARAICKALSVCSTPFDASITDKMQHLAISLIPWALMSTITESLANTIMSNKVSIFIGVDLGVIFVIVIIFILVQIFKYGAILQQESDETL
ncbi:MAG: DUF2975 domain-containing protein [Lachnospiraceae bacterium]|nr:DUF2975 domain-containing protein [Lachnospiraceae bacterium]